MSRTFKQTNPTFKDKKYNFGNEVEKISSQSDGSFSTNTTRLYKKINAGLITQKNFEEMIDGFSEGMSFEVTEDRIKTTRNKSTSVNLQIDFKSPQSAQMAFDMLSGISQVKLRDIPLDLKLNLKRTGGISTISVKTSDALVLENDSESVKDNSVLLQQREHLLKRNIANSISISALTTGIYSPFRDNKTNKLSKEDFNLNDFENLRSMVVKDVGFEKNDKFEQFMKENISSPNCEILQTEARKTYQLAVNNGLGVKLSALPKSKMIEQKETLLGKIKRTLSS